MRFAIDSTSAIVLLAALFLLSLIKIFLIKPSASPSLAFSKLDDLKQHNWRSILLYHSNRLHGAAIICLMIAFIDPHLLFLKSPIHQNEQHPIDQYPTEGIAIYLVLDQSGSMEQPVETKDHNRQKSAISKIDLLKKVTKQFILNHPSDLIGLVSFARVPRIITPLTLDQQTLLRKLNQIQVSQRSEDEGTAIGYAIYKTANLLSITRHFANENQREGRPPYTIKSAIMIVVTDGFQDPNRLDKGNRLRTLELDDAAAFAKAQNIRLYIINIDPVLSTAEYAPQRRQMQNITGLTGGKFYLISDAQGLQEIYSDIDQLEKGSIEEELLSTDSRDKKSDYHRVSLYPYLIFLSMIFLFTSLFLDSTLLRKIP
ncbi:MAG: VWA domain-containing protein [Parachlamydiaceae bacterium]